MSGGLFLHLRTLLSRLNASVKIGAGILLGVSVYFLHFNHPPEKIPIIAVEVDKSVLETVPIVLEAPGNIEAIQSAAILPEATGAIEKINFEPGQMVTKDQALFVIDPRDAVASLEQAQANLARDQATLKQNMADAKRYKTLAKQEYVTQQQAEQAQATAEAQKALVEADKAQIKLAQNQLENTQVQAPIAGRTGSISVKVGDLVVANSTVNSTVNNTPSLNPGNNPLVIINQMDPVWMTFYIQQKYLVQVLEYSAKAPLKVEAWDENVSKMLGKGEVVLIDNLVNPQTGTVLLKARLANPNKILWPGLNVAAKLILTTKPKTVVVPSSAVHIDQEGHFVYKVVNGKAAVQRIEVLSVVGERTAVRQGLRAGETVITVIAPGLAAGVKVKVRQAR